MKYCLDYKKKIAVLICAIFVICCVLFAFSSHLHNCSGSECSICERIKSLNDELAVLLTAPICCGISSSVLYCLTSCHDAVSKREHTPIGLKVKLSR